MYTLVERLMYIDIKSHQNKTKNKKTLDMLPLGDLFLFWD